MDDRRVSVELGGVAEALLWTLYQRSSEARRPDAVICDPLAAELVGRIDYPFEERFGDRFGQWQALRARCFDDAVVRFMSTHGDGTTIALGEGLETQFWRVDNGRVRWLSVDLADVIARRERLLPSSARHRLFACSALDPRWTNEIDASRGVLVTAQGLLMYLERTEAFRLIGTCAARFPGGRLVFDAVPQWLSERSRRGGIGRPGAFAPPPWLWGISAETERELAAIAKVRTETALRVPWGRGAVHGVFLPLLGRLGPLRRRMLSVIELDFETNRR